MTGSTLINVPIFGPISDIRQRLAQGVYHANHFMMHPIFKSVRGHLKKLSHVLTRVQFVAQLCINITDQTKVGLKNRQNLKIVLHIP